jgi:hypothetical protein
MFLVRQCEGLSDEAIQLEAAAGDCFTPLAMTAHG